MPRFWLPPPPRFFWPLVLFLLAFVGLVILLTWGYLFPAADALRDADTTGRRHIAAYSTLLLSVVLFLLLVGLAMTFRIHRYFFPRLDEPRGKTKYVDAWAESAKRMKVPSESDEE